MIQERDKVSPKFLQVANGIKKIILSQGLSDNSALPSHSELLKQFDVSQGTLRQSLDFLAKKGWIRSQRGKGVFVHKVPDEERREFLGSGAVGLLVVGGGLDDPVRRVIVDEAVAVASALGRDVHVQHIQPDTESFDVLRVFVSKVDSVALYGNVSKELIVWLKQNNIRVAVIGHISLKDTELEGVACFRADMVMAGRLAAMLLSAYGHKKISLILKGDYYYADYLRKGLCDFCESKILDVSGVYSCNQFEDLHSAAVELSRDSEVSGIVIDGGSPTRGILDIFSELGIRVPQDKSIIVITDGHVQEVTESKFSKIYPCTHVDIRLQAVTHEALEWLVSGAAHPVAKFIAPNICEGNTLRLMK